MPSMSRDIFAGTAGDRWLGNARTRLADLKQSEGQAVTREDWLAVRSTAAELQNDLAEFRLRRERDAGALLAELAGAS